MVNKEIKDKKNFNKVFGVGAHKTGTASLQSALNTLGIKCSHFDYRKEMLQGIKKKNYKFNFLETYDAAVDLPIPSIYKGLDKAYPNSKFILTIRDPQAWVKSLKKHLEASFPEFRGKNLRFIEEEALFHNREYFDEEECIKRLLKHNEEVKEYFKNRTEDLLIMDFAKGDGWEKLCPFLGVPIPDKSFPHKGKASSPYYRKIVSLVRKNPRKFYFLRVIKNLFNKFLPIYNKIKKKPKNER